MIGRCAPSINSGQDSGNTEGGRIERLRGQAYKCAIQEGLWRANQLYCPKINSPAVVQQESSYILAKQASILQQGQVQGPIYTTTCGGQIVGSNSYLNLWNGGATTESARIANAQAAVVLNQPRFASYTRWTPLPACPPLPALANSAGQPKPSLNTCLPNKNAVLASF